MYDVLRAITILSLERKNILQPQKQQTNRGFIFSLKENSGLVQCYFNDSRELNAKLKKDDYKILFFFQFVIKVIKDIKDTHKI